MELLRGVEKGGKRIEEPREGGRGENTREINI